MFKFLSPLAVAGAVLTLACLGAAPAQALKPLTFVSGKGTDSGLCWDPAHPCRTFQFAIDQTSPNGAIKALDPANYGTMIITKSISIVGIEGAGIEPGDADDLIVINIGRDDVVNLSHLTVDGVGFNVKNGIVLHSGGSLTITHCVVRNFTENGIVLAPRQEGPRVVRMNFLIGDTLVSDNANIGILVLPLAGSTQGTLDHVFANKNADGIFVASVGGEGAVPIDVTAVDSMATNNKGNGFVAANGVLRLVHSAATGNGTGVFMGGTVFSSGDNFINGNAIDVDNGALTPVALQ